jgi:hypothetical protein
MSHAYDLQCAMGRDNRSSIHATKLRVKIAVTKHWPNVLVVLPKQRKLSFNETEVLLAHASRYYG